MRLSSSSRLRTWLLSGSSELVVLPVVVTDKQGRYVSDLPSERFAVFDNGRRVPIELFSNEDTPVTVGVVIDASSSYHHVRVQAEPTSARRLNVRTRPGSFGAGRPSQR